jgi:hypothetical protein
MKRELYELIKGLYERSVGDSTELFRTMLADAGAEPPVVSPVKIPSPVETGNAALDGILECLERCVVEKRLSWLERNAGAFTKSGNPLVDGFHMFYEVYLGLSVPRDGEIVAATGRRLVTRWWNRCPTLEACLKTGLDTREVCRKAYEKPVQAFLSRIDPRLRFRRNYDALRPRTTYCEEIIEIGEELYKGWFGFRTSTLSHPRGRFKAGA